MGDDYLSLEDSIHGGGGSDCCLSFDPSCDIEITTSALDDPLSELHSTAKIVLDYMTAGRADPAITGTITLIIPGCAPTSVSASDILRLAYIGASSVAERKP